MPAHTALVPIQIAQVTQVASDAQASHDQRREHETQVIRQHRMKRLTDHVQTDPALLHEKCRYESEIARHAPAGKIVLTFDDGPEPSHTIWILDILRKHDVPAAFFLVGHKASQHPELVERIQKEGKHIVANHSWDHPNFHAIAPEQQFQEIEQAEQSLLSYPHQKLFRYPYGNSTCESNAHLRENGFRIVGWHIDTCDWAFDRNGTVDDREALSCGVLASYRKDFVGHVLSNVRAHGGGIILMHEIHPKTLAKLEEIIVSLKKTGYTFVPLSDPEFETSMH